VVWWLEELLLLKGKINFAKERKHKESVGGGRGFSTREIKSKIKTSPSEEKFGRMGLRDILRNMKIRI
jgi:hypothetical protein